MAIAAGTHQLGPDKGSLEIRTYREGMASKAGHDLIIDVTHWEGTLTVAEDGGPSTLELSADPRSLEIREGVGGLKPLSDKDRAEIRKNIDEKVLGRDPVSFRSRHLALSADGSRLTAEGDLTMAGSTRPITAELAVEAGGRVTGTIPVTQSDFGIKPYRGLMGALKVRDSLEVVVDVTPA
jgi:hypothetical protein